MQYRTVGRTGITVSHYQFGAMSFGALGNRDHDDCVRIIHRALDAGINTIDTADIYSSGESESIVAPARPCLGDEGFTLATRIDVGGVEGGVAGVERAVEELKGAVRGANPPRAEER